MKKIVVSKKRILSERELFKAKEKFHKNLAKLPFEEKLKILTQLQKIAKEIRKITRI